MTVPRIFGGGRRLFLWLAGGATVLGLRTLERAQAERLGRHYATAYRSRLFQAGPKNPVSLH